MQTVGNGPGKGAGSRRKIISTPTPPQHHTYTLREEEIGRNIWGLQNRRRVKAFSEREKRKHALPRVAGPERIGPLKGQAPET